MLTPEEITNLQNYHSSELSALNAIVKLTVGAVGQVADTAILTLLTNNSDQTRIPGVVRSSTTGSIAVECFSFSVANTGNADGILLGEVIKSGETLNFSAGALSNKFGSNTIAYDGTGTELLITYIF